MLRLPLEAILKSISNFLFYKCCMCISILTHNPVFIYRCAFASLCSQFIINHFTNHWGKWYSVALILRIFLL